MTPIFQQDFAVDARASLARFREALLAIFAKVGVRADEPQEISRRYKLDKTLTWRLSRVACDPDIWEASAYMPRRPSIQIVADRFESLVDPSAITELWEAFEQYELFVDRHAGDRDTLEIMLNGMTRDTTAKRLELFRKDGMQANAALFGVSTSIMSAIRVIVPSKTPGMLDVAAVNTFVGLRRLRAAVPWVVARIQVAQLADCRVFPEPIFPESENWPLVPQFCSGTPAIRKEQDGNGVQYVLEPGNVGNTGAETLVVGWCYRSMAPMRASRPGEKGEHGYIVATPAESLVNDAYIHRSLGLTFDSHAVTRGLLPGQRAFDSNPSVELPVPSELIRLGAPPDPSLPRFASHRAIVLATMQAMGYSLSEFEGVRLQMTYPPMPCMISIRHSLLES